MRSYFATICKYEERGGQVFSRRMFMQAVFGRCGTGAETDSCRQEGRKGEGENLRYGEEKKQYGKTEGRYGKVSAEERVGTQNDTAGNGDPVGGGNGIFIVFRRGDSLGRFCGRFEIRAAGVWFRGKYTGKAVSGVCYGGDGSGEPGRRRYAQG